ncbi:MAG: AraC family transcriptional regulator ligand-binding domain-containing protein [Nocardioides marinisabuli]|uniref:AraC family transcriptional regulator n=1 Tax=Nocardioides marinisabuli TaxID=419476 RepID=UPI003219C280
MSSTAPLPDRLAGWDVPRSADGVRHLLRHARARGLDPAALLLGTGLHLDDLGPGGVREVTAAQELRVVRALRHRVPDDGAVVGASYDVGSFGALGFALMTSRTVADVADVTQRFFDLSYAFVVLRVELVDDEVVAVLDGSSLPRDVRAFLVARDATAVRTVLDSLVPGGVGAHLEVGPDRAVLRFAATELDRPLAGGDAHRRELAEAVCRDLAADRRSATGLPQEVRVLITQRLADGAPMPVVAAALGRTDRTLRRQLAASGTSYRALLEEVRRSLGADLLRAGLPVAEVAARLGYAEPAALVHAHRRWTGRPPGAARRGPAPGVHPADGDASPHRRGGLPQRP